MYRVASLTAIDRHVESNPTAFAGATTATGHSLFRPNIRLEQVRLFSLGWQSG
jgi:hypothetical protein